MKVSKGVAATAAAGLVVFTGLIAAPLVGTDVALASTTVVSPGIVPAGGTSSAPASFTFQENTPGAWHGGGTIVVTIADSSGAHTLTFTSAAGGTPSPTFIAPSALGAAITSVAGDSFTVSIATDDGANALSFTVGNLYITASSGAASGPIEVSSGGTINPATYGPTSSVSSVTNAVGLLAQSYPAGATSIVVNVRSSCGFANVGALTTQSSTTYAAGHFIVDGYDAGPAGTVSAYGAATSGQQLLSGFAPLPAAVTSGALVTQANVPNCPSSLPALVALSVSASPATIAAGSAVTYTYRVTNPGSATLDSVVVTDTACSPVRYTGGDTDGDGLLQPGEAWTYTCTATPSATMMDSASVSAMANGKTTIGDASTTVTVSTLPPPATTPVTMSIATAIGVTTTGPFTTSTKVVQKGQYITVRIITSPALAGADIGIWIAKKGPNGVWSSFSPHTGRTADANGVVYYYYRAQSIAWLSFRARFYGNATYQPAWSHGTQARWTAQ